jgi:hypothetical protein
MLIYGEHVGFAVTEEDYMTALPKRGSDLHRCRRRMPVRVRPVGDMRRWLMLSVRYNTVRKDKEQQR